MTLIELLEQSAKRWGDREFLISEAESVTYGEFLAGVDGLAGWWAELGIRAGDRVAVILANVPEMLYAWFALARLWAVLVPVNPALAPAEIDELLRHLGPRALVGEAAHLAFHGGRPELVARVLVGPGAVPGAVPFAAVPPGSPPPHAARCGAETALTILQTSGTTGQAKGAELSHASYVLPAQEFVRWMEIVPGDRFLGCLPLFHLAGQSFAAAAVAGGAALVLVSRFSASRFWSQVRRHRITIVRHLGEMLAALCRPAPGPDERSHTLRAVYGGGARQEVAEEFERRFGVSVVEGYGLTETNTVLRNELRSWRLGSIGRPTPYSEVRIADEAGRPLPASSAAERHVGEIQVRRNPVMMSGYCGAREVTAACFVESWFRTGDLGYRDEDGYYFWVGRRKEIIRRRGETILPARLEEVLGRHPSVAAAAVVGVPDELGGEEVKAYLLARAGGAPSPEALVAWCRPYLADFEIPRYFEICDDLPSTATHKIHKSDLRRLGTAGFPCYDRAARCWLPTGAAAGAALRRPAGGPRPVADGILGAVGNTPLVRLRRMFAGARFECYAKLEALNPGGSIKDRPALSVLEDALRSGAIGPGTVVVESSSGNMGIGLAQACLYHGLRFVCVVDVKTAAQNIRVLRAYGAEVDCVAEPDPATGEFLQARLNRVQQILQENPHAFWPNQYANRNNAESHYRTTMAEVVAALGGRLDYLFVATSTCGTIRGCSEYARDHGLDVHIVAVDAVGSLIFSNVKASRMVPGLGAGLKPPLLDATLIDECVHVTDLDCIAGCRRLVAQEAVLAGGSSGGVIAAIGKLRHRIPAGAVCVAILPDRGERYLDTLYSDEWVHQHFGDVDHLWTPDRQVALYLGEGRGAVAGLEGVGGHA